MGIGKYTMAIAILGVSCMMFDCATEKKVACVFPVEMKEPIRMEYAKICDKGQILYDINCGKCHTKSVRGKKIVPDFTSEQLKGYEIRVSNSTHEQNLPEENVTPEELGQIMTFLSYKKRNEVPIRAKK